MPPAPLPCQDVQSRPIDDADPAVRTHRHGCAACRDAARRLQASWDAMNLVPDREPSPQFTARVMATIERTAGRTWFGLPSPFPGAAVRWTVLAGGLAAALLVTALLFNREQIGDPANGSEAVAEVDLLESQDLLQDLEVVEDLDLLLLIDEG